ncbi:hypothetical protein C8A03DRAFT_19364 [Achaetomium macrosporum]|uniref:Mid2 domain-containing protein n=1 Tax=Achaetomium macrosporum TaxID=79813 RepID=A0AAN7C205_9PEZI|nr:hypothetical protein C8A03DRAFT_19364 [Achaetomium macrosporum]
MRIVSKGTGWLAVVALGLGTVRGDSVTFTTASFNGDFEDPNQAIFYFDNVPSKRFEWTVSQGAVVDEVILFKNDTGSLIPIGSGTRGGSISPPPVLPTPDTPSTSTPTADAGDAIDDRGTRNQRGIITGRAENVTLSGGQVSFSSGFSSAFIAGFELGTPLYLQARWSTGSSSAKSSSGDRPNGESYSRPFTFVNSPGEYREVLQLHPVLFSNPEPYRPEETNTASPTPTTNDQSPDSTSVQPAGNSEISEKAPNGGGGLSSGAVIGIAVACGVVGLALVFGLVWYLLRRRQQKKAMLSADPAYGSGNRTEDLMAEKEAAADVDVSPNSPYSDEGASGPGPSGTYQDGAAHGDALAAGAAGSSRQLQQDQPRSFTPYSDSPSASAAAAGTPSIRAASLAQTDEARVSVPSTTPGRATPRALTTPYAHLVEEGMTEEEIRRLEEEERQLDAAIEQAGRR